MKSLRYFLGKFFDGAILLCCVVAFVGIPFLIVKNAVFPEKELRDIYGTGTSMGDDTGTNIWYHLDPSATPKIGDVISFKCVSEKCNNNSTFHVIHRLTKIETDGCMHIEGDSLINEDSWDTRDYGCLMPDEIKIEGVVVDYPSISDKFIKN